MKTSLIALVSGCALASVAMAVFELPQVTPPHAVLAELPQVTPPHAMLAELPQVTPPHVA